MKAKLDVAKRSGYRLPTDAEWEYACRAGSVTRWCMGDAEDLLTKYAWITTNAASRSHPVGSLRPNDFGLFDLHGNLWEWCQDRIYDWRQEEPLALGGASTVGFLGSPLGPGPLLAASARSARSMHKNEAFEVIEDQESNRSIRGGAATNNALDVRSAYRYWGMPTLCAGPFGFRPAQTCS